MTDCVLQLRHNFTVILPNPRFDIVLRTEHDQLVVEDMPVCKMLLSRESGSGESTEYTDPVNNVT